VPVIVTVWVWFRLNVLGATRMIVGPALTVKQLAHEPFPASGFVTVTLLDPVVAFDARVMFAVSDVAETNVVEFTVMPVPENDATAPLTKFVPVIVMFWLAAP
jgi:hypothetical protein